MPMAGDGSRFKDAGYTVPKPLIEVDGVPMFVHAVETCSLPFDDIIFIVRKEHNISDTIRNYYPNSKVIEITNKTQGAVCTVLLADLYMSNHDSVFIANCDQILGWNSGLFLHEIEHSDPNAAVLLFHNPEREDKWSFADYNLKSGIITRVAEKDPISEWASTGHYYWRSWSEFKFAAKDMIRADDKVRGEFYICPVLNYTHGLLLGAVVDTMTGLGTPEDLQAWQDSFHTEAI